MKIYIVSLGEPLPIDSKNVRLRRMGNLAECISKNINDEVIWFSDSFEHYTKTYRCLEDTDYNIKNNYKIKLIHSKGYKKNISINRLIHYKVISKKIIESLKSMDKPDIIISTMAPLELTEMIVKYGIENNVPVVTDIRDLWPEIYYDIIPKYIHWVIEPYVLLCKKKLKFIMKNTYSIIGLSKYFLEYGLKYGQREKNDLDAIFPISYPNYNYDEYADKFEEIWKKYNLSKNDFIVTFIGNFGKQFKFEEIIEASKLLKEYKDIKFVLCGVGRQLENIKKEANENIIFTGWIEKDYISSLLSKTSIGIAPYIDSINYRNNTPNKFGEYLSAGIPILVSVSGEMENLLEDNYCGHRYSTAEELAARIEKYYKDYNYLNQQKNNSRKLYELLFNSDTAYKKMSDHLRYVSESYKNKVKVIN